MNHLLKAIIKTVILSLIASLLFYCAGTIQRESEPANEQNEQDLIKLLNEQQTKPTEVLTEIEQEKINQQIAGLEKKYKDSQDLVNTLKSENVLKDERIHQLEEQLQQPETVKEFKPVQQKEPAATVSTVPLSDYMKEYQSALNAFMSKQYQQSLEMFQRLLEKDNSHILSDNCRYWIGESYFAMKNYRKAIIEFEKVFTYLKSNKDDDAQLKLGICYKRLGDVKRAKEEFEKLINNYPKSEYVLRAKTELKKIN